MTDEKLIEQMVETQSERNLRDCLQQGKTFIPSSNADEKVLENFNQMNEDDKKKFIEKRWING